MRKQRWKLNGYKLVNNILIIKNGQVLGRATTHNNKAAQPEAISAVIYIYHSMTFIYQITLSKVHSQSKHHHGLICEALFVNNNLT